VTDLSSSVPHPESLGPAHAQTSARAKAAPGTPRGDALVAEALKMAYHVLPAFDTGSMDTAYDVAWGALRLLSARDEVPLAVLIVITLSAGKCCRCNMACQPRLHACGEHKCMPAVALLRFDFTHWHQSTLRYIMTCQNHSV
jgi:hypothetical protein